MAATSIGWRDGTCKHHGHESRFCDTRRSSPDRCVSCETGRAVAVLCQDWPDELDQLLHVLAGSWDAPVRTLGVRPTW